MNQNLRFAIAVLLGAVIPISLFAQNNYWAQQFGAKSALMSGAVVAGVKDNSALFYNPGALGFIDNSNLNVSANVYGLEIVNLRNAVGQGLDLNSTRPVLYPQLVSGIKKFKKTPRLVIAYGLITRSKTDLRMQQEYATVTEVIKDSPGLEYYNGKIEYLLNSLEQWGGIGVAYRISDKFSLGVTTFINYLHLDDRNYVSLSADAKFDSVPYSTSFTELTSHNIDNFSLLWKVGAALNLGAFKMGLTVTTPSINLFGWGRMNRSIEAYNVDKYLPNVIPIASYPTYILSDQQRKLETTYKTPPSIALGVEYKFQKTGTRIGIATEYFFRIKEYEILRGKDQAYVRPIEAYGGEIIPNFLVARGSSVQVINVGVGLEQRINERIYLFLGSRTDFNSTISLLNTTGGNANSLNPNYWHFLHFTLGGMYHKGSSDLTIGINYGYGITDERRQLINITSPQDVTLLQGARDDSMAANVHSLALIVGYTYYIKR